MIGERVDGWWLCPNEPRRPHPAVVHDIEDDGRDWAEDIPTCCTDGCDCGHNGAIRMA